MRDFRPFLQIVHAWGLRAAAPGLQAYRGVRALARAAHAAGKPALAHRLAETCAHDGFAARAFREFLAAVAIADPLWRRLPTWLLDAGDRSLLGDRDSLALGEQLHRAFAVASDARVAVALPGPRDDWPGAPPALRPADTARHRAWARVHAFPTRFPAQPFVERAPTGRLDVQLFALDTVASSAAASLAGRGRIEREDLDRLGALADQARRGDEVRALRVLLTHHPVDASLAGAGPNLGALAGPTPAGLRPLVHLILHGGADEPRPAPGALADATPALPRALSIGPLLGFDPLGARGAAPQQCQVLRLYCSPARPHAVLLERLLATRAGGTGPFRFVPVAPDGEVAEELVIQV